MTERLKKLLSDCMNNPEKTCPRPDDVSCDGCKYDIGEGCDMIGRYADHLLANGVIAPKVKAGQTVWFPSEYHEGAYPVIITHLEIYEEEIILYSEGCGEYLDTDIGKILFLTKEEAEKVLAERSANNG